MAITTWSLFIDHIVMLLCHVMFTKVILIKMHLYRVSIGLISTTSPLTSIMICQVSPNPMGVLKPILLMESLPGVQVTIERLRRSESMLN